MTEEFLRYLQYEKNRSQLTVKAYSDDLRAFEAYFKGLDDQLSWESIDADIIRDWMESMMNKGNNATSVNRRLSALRSLYRFALSHGMIETDPTHLIRGPKKDKPLPQFLKEKEINSLIVSMPSSSYKDVRARTLIILLYTTGIRLAELTGLDDASVDFANSQIKVHGKRDKDRVIPFGDELAKVLRDYISRRNHDVERKCDALFLTDKGERMKDSQVRYEVRKNVSRVTSIKERTPHVLRHTFATAMLNHGTSIEKVQKLLGHERLATTEIYTHTTFEQLKKVYNDAHPRA